MIDRKEILKKAWNSRKYATFLDNGKGILKEDLGTWLNSYSMWSNDELLEEYIEENVEDDDYSCLLQAFAQDIWDGQYEPSNYEKYWKDTMY